MNPWAIRRKTIVFIIIFFAFALTIAVPAYLSTREKPNCNNGKQDGDETGVDCGGGCQLICKPEALPLITKGDARILKIATSTYEVAILLENPNIGGKVVRAPYTFTVFSGTAKAPVAVIKGETYIERNSTFALFGGPFTATSTLPLRAILTWDKPLVWEKSTDAMPNIAISSSNLTPASTSPTRLEASLMNKSLQDANNIEVIALLSDQSGNMVGAGRTFVDSIAAGGSVPVVFTWAWPFASEPVSTRIIPHILPDKSYLH